jgi:hypothetical protein
MQEKQTQTAALVHSSQENVFNKMSWKIWKNVTFDTRNKIWTIFILRLFAVTTEVDV